MDRRIAVIGTTSGTGKTTLAGELAARLGLTHVELDALHHGPGWTEASAEELRARVDDALASADGWVVDGNYMGKLGRSVLERADTVVWLDLPVRVWLPRLLRRTVHRVRGKVELWNGNRESFRGAFLSWDSLFVYALRAHFRRRRVWASRLEGLPVLRLRTPEEVRRWLAAQTPPRG